MCCLELVECNKSWKNTLCKMSGPWTVVQ